MSCYGFCRGDLVSDRGASTIPTLYIVRKIISKMHRSGSHVELKWRYPSRVAGCKIYARKLRKIDFRHPVIPHQYRTFVSGMNMPYVPHVQKSWQFIIEPAAIRTQNSIRERSWFRTPQHAFDLNIAYFASQVPYNSRLVSRRNVW